MTISKKVLGLALGAVLVSNVGVVNTASADEKVEEILFKIHNIEPVKNREGDVIACDFNTTVYNRSPNQLKGATLELKWKDASIENIISEEKSEDARKRNRNVNRSYSETERRTSAEVFTEVEVPTLGSFKQVTLNNRISTDRCFLLVGDVDVTVRECSVDGVGGADKATRRGKRENPCSNMFKFVSPADAQYHVAFKEITLNEENAQQEALKKEKMKGIKDIYSGVVNDLNTTGTILNSIK